MDTTAARKMADHAPVITSSRARFCGKCGKSIMFDPKTLKPYHVPECPDADEPHDYQPNGRDSAGMTE